MSERNDGIRGTQSQTLERRLEISAPSMIKNQLIGTAFSSYDTDELLVFLLSRQM